MINRLID